MSRPHVSSGGRYPVLRTLAILYVVGAALVLCYGIYRIGWALFAPPGWVHDRLTASLTALVLTALAVVTSLLAAEVIKLLIDVEHHTRTAAGAPGTTAASVATSEADQESAEASLLRGH